MNLQRLSNLERSLGERLLAWAYTGPLGHLYSALADTTVMWVRHTRTRARSSSRASGSKKER